MIRIAVIMGKMDSGGKKNLVMEYYRHIDREKVQFDFICDSDSQAIPDEEIQSLGGRIYRIAPYQRIIQNMLDIRKLCIKNRYQVMHAYNSTMNVFPMFIAKMTGVPVRISESLSMAHEGEFKTVLKKLLKPMSKWFATHYMSCGEDCGRWQFGDKLFDAGKVAVFKTVVNTEFNKYDPELRERTRKEYELEGKMVIGHIGRFVPQKNPLFLLDIVAEVFKREKDAILLLIGDGDLREEMHKKIEKLGISNQIKYLGRREDIQPFYNAMDAFLLPSLYEGLPVVGLEAQSCGLPMFFSTEVTAEASVCELGHFLKLSDSPEKWAAELIKAMKENISVRKSRARDVAEAGFDSTSEALRLQKYYINALKEVKGKTDNERIK